MEMAASENGAASGAETSPAAAADDAEAVDVDVVDAKGDVTGDDRVAARVAELEAEVGEVRAQNEALQRNLDDALSEICVAGCVKESLIELERQNATRLDEVATLQHLLNETSEEARWVRMNQKPIH